MGEIKIKKFLCIFDRPINVNCVKRQKGDVFEESETQELKNLVLHGYLKEVEDISGITDNKKEKKPKKKKETLPDHSNNDALKAFENMEDA